MVLYQRIHHRASGGEVRNHIWLLDDELSIEDIVIGVVAVVEDKWEIHNETSGVSLTIGTGVGLVRWHAVVCEKLGIALSVNDDASTGAFHI